MTEDRHRINKRGILIVFVCALFAVFFALAAFGSEKWPGVDEAVVEKIATEHGRAASEALINTDQGDLLLFVFLLAGAAGGFAAGYSWRMLATEKTDSADEKNQRNRYTPMKTRRHDKI